MKLDHVSRQAHVEEFHRDGRSRDAVTQQMGVQVPRGFIPKCRRKTLYAQLRRYLGEVFRRLAQQKESRIEQGHLMPDHVHYDDLDTAKYAVSQVVGYIKGKSWIHLARVYGEQRRNFVGQHLWARG